MKFYTIVPFSPLEIEKMAEECKRLNRDSGLDFFLPSMTMHPESADPYAKLDLFIRGYAELKEALKNTPIKLGVLCQTFMGHGWSSSNSSKNSFQQTVNHFGKSRGRFCPLDPGFLEYCGYAVTELAKLGPECFLLDDDTRLLDNDKVECFCPLHLAKFSKKYSRDELIELVMNSKPGDPIIKEFEEVRRKSLEDFGRHIRKCIDAVDPNIPCGISGPGREQNIYGRMAKAVAGDTRPFVRVGNALYFENSAKELPRRVWQTAIMIKGCGKDVDWIDESDTYPHNLYSKSASGMHSHITSAILYGAAGAKVWISNFLNPNRGAELRNVEFEDIFKEYTPFYRSLQSEVAKTAFGGIGIPVADLEKQFHPKTYPDYFTCPEWGSDSLGFLGIPYNYCEPDDKNVKCLTFTAAQLDHLTDEQVSCFAEKNLFIEAGTALKLKEMGLGDLLGADVEPDCPHFSTEFFPKENCNMRLLYSAACGKLIPGKDSRVISDLYKRPYAAAAQLDHIAPGAVISTNAFGKKCAIWAGYNSIYVRERCRKLWLIDIFDELAETPLYCMNVQDVYCRCGIQADGALLTSVMNLNYDMLKNVRFKCRKAVSRIETLAPSGQWQEAAFSEENGIITVDTAVMPYMPVIFKLS